MTEYDYSPEGYERYMATQNRIAKWVDTTEQHRPEFQSVASGRLQDLSRSGPESHSRSSPSPLRPQHPQPKQPFAYSPPSESDESDSTYFEDAPGPMPRQSRAMALPQQPAFHPMQQQPPMMMPPVFATSPHRVSHHHRHRSHDQRRSRSHHSPPYIRVTSPPQSPAYQYPYPMSAGHQGYVMMPQYGGMQVPLISSLAQPPLSAPANYFQPQPNSHQGMTWSTYGTPPGYPMMSTPSGSQVQSPPYTYQPFVLQQPPQSSCLLPPTTHQRIYDLSKPGSGKYFRRSVG